MDIFFAKSQISALLFDAGARCGARRIVVGDRHAPIALAFLEAF